MEYSLCKFRSTIHFMSGIPMQVKRLKEQGQKPMGNKKDNYNHGVFLSIIVQYYNKY